MRKKEKGTCGNGTAWTDILLAVLKGGVLAGVSSVVLLLGCAILLSEGILREEDARICVIASCGLSAAAGSLFAGRKIKCHSVLVGLGVALLFAFFLATAGLLAYGGIFVKEWMKLAFVAVLLGGLMGWIGRKPKKKRKK